MTIGTLDDLFSDGLKDIYYAEKQILRTLGQLMKKAQSERLRQALESHRRETEQHVGRLEQVMALVDEKPRGKKCPGIEGILKEGSTTVEEIDEKAVRDAAIVSAAQAVEHYEISRYGTLIAWARHLGHDEAVGLLEETLVEEKAADEKLSELADSEVNHEACAASGKSVEAEAEDEEGGETSTRRRMARSGKSPGMRDRSAR